MKRIIIVSFVLAVTVQIAFSQSLPLQCGFDSYNQNVIKNDPAKAKQQEEFNQAFLQYAKTVDLKSFKATPVGSLGKTGTPKYIIPVVFHIVHNGNLWYENISDATVQQEIKNMNDNFNGNAPYRARIRSIFRDVEANAGIEFRLAKIKLSFDSLGNITSQVPTTGIDHVYVGPLSDKANDYQKANSWNPTRYLNVWVCNSILQDGAFGVGGYATFPNGYSSSKYDGVIVSVGNGIGTLPSSGYYNPFSLMTVSHEVGHYFGLLHPFNGSYYSGATNYDSCGEDYCYDVPPVYYTPASPNNSHNANDTSYSSWIFSSPPKCATPALPDQWENIMDYYTGFYKSNMFSLQQVARMYFTLENYRRNLWSQDNLTLTGVIDSTPALTVPIAEFNVVNNQNLTDVRTCVNNPITFKDNSFNGTITAWHWDFGDGFTSEVQSPPAVTYTSPGYKTVSLKVTGANGSNTNTKTNYIYIEGSNDVTQKVAAYNADWDWENDFLKNGWHFENESPFGKFVRTTSVYYDGCASMMLRSNSEYDNGKMFPSKMYNYSLISPPFDFRNSTSPYLQFYYAFASNFLNPSSSDRPFAATQDALAIHVSTDCGLTWSVQKWKSGGYGYELNHIPGINIPNPPNDIISPNPLSTFPVTNTGGNPAQSSNMLATENFVPSSTAQWKKVTYQLPSTLAASPILKYKITFSCQGGNNLYLDNLMLGMATGVNEVGAKEIKFNVHPNPLTESTKINYIIPSKSNVDIRIYDIIGKEIGVIVSETQDAGMQNINLNKSDFNLRSGLYFIKLRLDNTHVVTQKIVVN